MLVAVLSDTHLPGRGRALPRAAWELVERADRTLHAGDVVSAALLHELAAYGPLHVAMGNCDLDDVHAWGARTEVLLDLDGVRVAMVHDAGPAGGRARRLRRRFPDADVVVFGHSHQPVVEHGLDGMLLVNPGSPTDRRRAPHHTVVALRIEDGVPSADVVVVD